MLNSVDFVEPTKSQKLYKIIRIKHQKPTSKTPMFTVYPVFQESRKREDGVLELLCLVFTLYSRNLGREKMESQKSQFVFTLYSRNLGREKMESQNSYVCVYPVFQESRKREDGVLELLCLVFSQNSYVQCLPCILGIQEEGGWSPRTPMFSVYPVFQESRKREDGVLELVCLVFTLYSRNLGRGRMELWNF